MTCLRADAPLGSPPPCKSSRAGRLGNDWTTVDHSLDRTPFLVYAGEVKCRIPPSHSTECVHQTMRQQILAVMGCDPTQIWREVLEASPDRYPKRTRGATGIIEGYIGGSDWRLDPFWRFETVNVCVLPLDSARNTFSESAERGACGDRDQVSQSNDALIADRLQGHQASLHDAIDGATTQEDLRARLDPGLAVLSALNCEWQIGQAGVKTRRFEVARGIE